MNCASILLRTRERIVYFCGSASIDPMGETLAAMPKLQELHLINLILDHRFLHPDLDRQLANGKLSRRYSTYIWRIPSYASPIIPYLIHQTSGGQRILLTVSGEPQHICKDVLRE